MSQRGHAGAFPSTPLTSRVAGLPGQSSSPELPALDTVISTVPHPGTGTAGFHTVPPEGLRWESQAGAVVTDRSFEPGSKESFFGGWGVEKCRGGEGSGRGQSLPGDPPFRAVGVLLSSCSFPSMATKPP